MPTSIPIPGPLKGARFVDRPNRFVVRVALEPEETVVTARLLDPAAHAALLKPDHRAWVRPVTAPNGEPGWGLALIQSAEGALVSLEPLVIQALVHRSLLEASIPELAEWHVEATDVPLGRSRASFQLSTIAGDPMLVGLFVATRVENGVALFPDGTNEHASNQLRELAQACGPRGQHATALFVVPRNDATGVAPNEIADPDLADALRAAEGAGVRLLGRRCQVTLAEAMLGVAIPVDPWDLPFR